MILLTHIPTIVLSAVILLQPSPSYAQSQPNPKDKLTLQDIEDINNGREWYDPNQQCNSSLSYSSVVTTNSGPVEGLDGLAFITNLNEQKAVTAIDNYILSKQPSSPFVGLGRDFIAGAKKSNVNPFLAVAHIQVESGFATAPVGWHTIPGSHNAFGLTASSSQPHVLSSGGRLVYAWPSWSASLNSNDPNFEDWFSWINRRVNEPGSPFYGKTFRDYVYSYAPPGENDTEKYISDVISYINDIASLMNDPNIQPIPYSGGDDATNNTPCTSLDSPNLDTSSVVSTALSLANNRVMDTGQNSELDATTAYVDAKKRINPEASWSDCGGFIATVMRISGADPNYPLLGTALNQKPYLESHPEKYQILRSWSESDLQPGDIFIRSGHTFMYIGRPGIEAVQASLGDRVPGIRPYGLPSSGFNGYVVARLKQ